MGQTREGVPLGTSLCIRPPAGEESSGEPFSPGDLSLVRSRELPSQLSLQTRPLSGLTKLPVSYPFIQQTADSAMSTRGYVFSFGIGFGTLPLGPGLKHAYT